MSAKVPHKFGRDNVCTVCGTETTLDHGIQLYREAELSPWVKRRPSCLTPEEIAEILADPAGS